MANCLRRVIGSSSAPTTSLLFAHPNGFNQNIWSPIIEDLNDDLVCQKTVQTVDTKSANCLSFDFQGHGSLGHANSNSIHTTTPNLEPARNWLESTRQDVLQAVSAAQQHEQHEQHRIGVGMSLGGAALLLAQYYQPSLFSHLFLMEPVLLCDHNNDNETIQTHRVVGSPFEAKARKRRNRFNSRAHAVEYFSSRKAWSRFDPRAVQAYVDGGITTSVDEKGCSNYLLSCTPEYEAMIYTSLPIISSNILEQIGSSCDVTLVVGEESSFTLDSTGMDKDAVEYYSRRIAPSLLKDNGGEAGIRVLKGCTHNAPMERPSDVAKMLRELYF